MKEKWRPRLSLVVLAILVLVLVLPLASLVFFRFYENQLVRQTEAELIAQGAALGATFVHELRQSSPMPPAGPPVTPDGIDPALGRYRPIEPTLDLAVDLVLPQRPDAEPVGVASPYAAVGAQMKDILIATQRSTLTGFRLLDPAGIVIAGAADVGASLSGIEEVRGALSGRYRSVIRRRVSNELVPPLYSISRGTGIRVFVAMPIVVQDRLAGVLYLSRTPSNILKHLYGERGKLALAALTVVTATLLIAFLFGRTISGPMQELRRRTARVAAGDATALQPLTRHGTREMAELSVAFLDMARKLHTRSDAIRTFATHLSHELKSPLTSIRGAAELLRDEGDEMAEAARRRFLDNILADTRRLDALLRRLIELTRAENAERSSETSSLSAVLNSVAAGERPTVSVEEGGDIPLHMSAEALGIVLANLVDNSARHGASCVTIAARSQGARVSIDVRDDGVGIAEANRGRVFEPFFTTRRDEGGTGLGLGIVVALLKAHDGTIRLNEVATGAGFTLDLPEGGPH